MNVLPLDKQIAVVSALTEGCSIRTTERLTGIHRDTIMRLAARVGFGAMRFHDHKVHSLRVNRVELDEAWSYVGKKQRRVTPAMALGLADHIWTIGELLTACLDNAPAKPRKVRRRFKVIQGGKI